MAEQTARIPAPFARATREALESVAAAPVATSLLFRALTAASFASVPEDAASFRAFLDGPLRTELQRSLGPAAVTLVLGRLGQVALMNEAATSNSSWPPKGRHESGSHPVVRTREPFPVHEVAGGKRPTLPAPPSMESPDASVTRAPTRRLRPAAVTMPALPKMERLRPSCVIVVSTAPSFAAEVQREIAEQCLAEQCPVVLAQSAGDLARGATHGGERIVVLAHTFPPALDLPTFTRIAPLLPSGTRVVLWGASARTLQSLGMPGWIASGEATSPGAFALSVV